MFPMDSSIPQLPEFHSLALLTEVPIQSELLPDGRTMLVSGDTEAMARYLAQDGMGIELRSVSSEIQGCAQMIRQFDPEFQPQHLLAYAERFYPSALEAQGTLSGRIALEEVAQTLNDFDIPAHLEQAHSLEDLAHHLESGSGVLLGINLGELWNAPDAYENGETNAVAVGLAVGRDAATGEIIAWFLNDVVARSIRMRVEASRLERAWLEPGGWLVVTDIARSRRSVE